MLSMPQAWCLPLLALPQSQIRRPTDSVCEDSRHNSPVEPQPPHELQSLHLLGTELWSKLSLEHTTRGTVQLCARPRQWSHEVPGTQSGHMPTRQRQIGAALAN